MYTAKITIQSGLFSALIVLLFTNKKFLVTFFSVKVQSTLATANQLKNLCAVCKVKIQVKIFIDILAIFSSPYVHIYINIQHKHKYKTCAHILFK